MKATVTDSCPNLVGGRLKRAVDGAGFARANPARLDDVVCRFPEASLEDLEAAIAAVHSTQPSWAATSPLTRAEVLQRAAARIDERREAIARDLTREEGKPLTEARAEVQTGAAMLRYMASLAALAAGEVFPSVRPGVFIHTMRQPRGLVAVLTPWNFPFSIPCFKLGAALAGGNGVVLKPSPYTPLTAWRVVEALMEAGLPERALSFLTDSAGAMGRALVAHPAVQAISFTGSTATGRAIAETTARRLVPCQLELGGKNALVVLEDADLDVAASVAIAGAFSGTGQKCTSTGRALVARKVVQPFLERVLARAAEIRVGPGLDEGTTMGPVVSPERLERILTIVSGADREGARCLFGGRRLDGEGYQSGLFLAPTVLTDVSSENVAAREEIFGPVLVVIPVRDQDEALSIANDSAFGLVSGVCTRDPRKAFQFARASRTGVVKINESTTGVEHQVPSGGWGDSGFGDPELGPSALHFFSAVKSVYWNHGSV